MKPHTFPGERGISFVTPMVQAIDRDEKTETRRCIRIDDTPIRVPARVSVLRYQRGIPTNAENVRFFGPYLKCDAPPGSNTVSSRVLCPYGGTGTRLYVKETWRPLDDTGLFIAHRAVDPELGGPWKSGRFMPKAASRLWLIVEEARAERLQAITPAGVRDEGLACTNCRTGRAPALEACRCLEVFARGWDTIGDRKPEQRWAANPWVWIIRFRRERLASIVTRRLDEARAKGLVAPGPLPPLVGAVRSV